MSVQILDCVGPDGKPKQVGTVARFIGVPKQSHKHLNTFFSYPAWWQVDQRLQQLCMWWGFHEHPVWTYWVSRGAKPQLYRGWSRAGQQDRGLLPNTDMRSVRVIKLNLKLKKSIHKNQNVLAFQVHKWIWSLVTTFSYLLSGTSTYLLC